MYAQIAHIMNRDYGSCDLTADDVERYLRYGDDHLLSGDEIIQIEVVLDRLLD